MTWATLHSTSGEWIWEMHGYAISPRVHRDWTKEEPLLAADETAARIFLPRGRAPRIREIHGRPELGPVDKVPDHREVPSVMGWEG
jgi:hypothetical protein